MTNKKRKIKKNEIISSLLAGSFLFSSCSDGLILLMDHDQTINFTKDKYAINNKEGISLIPISMHLSNSEISTIKSLRKLSQDIITNKKIAAEFSSDYKKVLSLYNIDEEFIDVDSEEVQLLFALGSDDILNAINKKDFKLFLEILKNKGLLQSNSIKKLTTLLESEDIKNMKMPSDARSAIVDQELSPICAIALAIYFAVATIAVVEVAFWVHFAVKTVGAEEIYDNNRVEREKLSEEDFYLTKFLEDKAINLYLNQSLTYDTSLDKYQDVEIILKETFSQMGLEEKDYNKSLVLLSETIKRNLNHK